MIVPRRVVRLAAAATIAILAGAGPAALASSGGPHASAAGMTPRHVQRVMNRMAGSPGTPQPPAVVYQENFENTGLNPVLLTSYTGASGAKYTAAPPWLTACNGDIVTGNSPNSQQGASNCTAANDYSSIRQLAWALGDINGSATPQANHAVSAYTANNPGANNVEFQTVNPIPLTAANRFLTFSVNAAETNCFANHALLNFNLLNGTQQIPLTSKPIDPCSDPRAKALTIPALGANGPISVSAGEFTADGSVLFSGSSVGVQMVNAQGSGVGNDHSFDDIKILDATPALDKAFSPTSALVGGTSTLTFTITNTTDLAAKNGWSFTDALPAGLTVAGGTPATTCPGGVVTAPAGGSQIAVTGNLAANMASCTVTLDVTSGKVGKYTNGPGNVTTTGLDAPGSTSVDFARVVDLNSTKTASPDPFVPGEKLIYTLTVNNRGPSDAPGTKVTDKLPAGLEHFTWTCAPTAPSKCGQASGTGSISTTADIAAGSHVTYTITGIVPPGQTSVKNTATITPPPDGTDPGCTPDCTSTADPDPEPHVSLHLTKTAMPNPARAGGPLTYTIKVTNGGPSDATGVRVQDPLAPPIRHFIWTCHAGPGSKCHQASGSGPISTTADVAAHGLVSYTLTGTLPRNTHGQVRNSATVTPPPGSLDPACTPDCRASVTVHWQQPVTVATGFGGLAGSVSRHHPTDAGLWSATPRHLAAQRVAAGRVYPGARSPEELLPVVRSTGMSSVAAIFDDQALAPGYLIWRQRAHVRDRVAGVPQ